MNLSSGTGPSGILGHAMHFTDQKLTLTAIMGSVNRYVIYNR